MAAMSDYLENKLIDHVFRGTAYSAPPTLYLGLLTSAASDVGGGTEVSSLTSTYARVPMVANTTLWSGTNAYGFTGTSSGTSGNTANIIPITFASPNTNWGLVTSFGIYDAATAGNLLFYGNLNISKNINNGDAAPSFTANSLIIQIDN